MLVGAHITRETGFQGGTTVSRTGKQLEEIEQDELEEIELEHVRKADGEVYAEVRRRMHKENESVQGGLDVQTNSQPQTESAVRYQGDSRV